MPFYVSSFASSSYSSYSFASTISLSVKQPKQNVGPSAGVDLLLTILISSCFFSFEIYRVCKQNNSFENVTSMAEKGRTCTR